MTWLWIILAVIVVLVIWFISVRNGLVHANNQIEEAYSTMDVYMKKRYDLIPNLVNTVKGYASHEKETLLAVEQASMKASRAGSVQEQAQVVVRRHFAQGERGGPEGFVPAGRGARSAGHGLRQQNGKHGK